MEKWAGFLEHGQRCQCQRGSLQTDCLWNTEPSHRLAGYEDETCSKSQTVKETSHQRRKGFIKKNLNLVIQLEKKQFTCRDKLIQWTRITENDHFIEVFSEKHKLQSDLLCHLLSFARQSLRIYYSRRQWLCVQWERKNLDIRMLLPLI